jgi:hypothetical protein
MSTTVNQEGIVLGIIPARGGSIRVPRKTSSCLVVNHL